MAEAETLAETLAERWRWFLDHTEFLPKDRSDSKEEKEKRRERSRAFWLVVNNQQGIPNG